MQIQPLQSNILCTVHEGKESILHLPAGVEMQPYAKVIAIGPDCKHRKVGELVLFNPSNVIFADDIDEVKTVIVPEGCCFAQYILDENMNAAGLEVVK